MKQWSLFLLIALAGCADGPGGVLLQPPFAALTDSIDAAPNKADLYYRRAQLLQQYEQHALAEKDFEKAWGIQPEEDYAIGKARYLINRNRDSAIAFLKDATSKLPESIILQISLAREYKEQNKWDSVIVVCNRIILGYPNQLDALQLKASALKAQKKNDEALATLEQAYYYAPFDAELVHSLAFDYAEAKNPKTLSLADSLIKADSLQRHAEPYYFKGVYFANVGNNTAALQQFDEAIQHNYNFLDAHLEKGVLLYENRDYAAAQKSFALATTIDPAFADAYYWMGKIAEAKKDNRLAKEQYLRAYSLDKQLTEAKAAADRL